MPPPAVTPSRRAPPPAAAKGLERPRNGPHVWEEKHVDANWPKEALGAPCTHTFRGSRAAAGRPRAPTAAGTRLPEPGMPSAPVVGTSSRRGSSTALRRVPLGDLGVPARAGASLSICGTLCGRAPIKPQLSPRAALGSGGQSAPVPTAGPPRCR